VNDSNGITLLAV